MINLFKKKPPEQMEADKKVEEVRFKAEQEERLKLAEEHGRFDAQRKYGKFKQPSILLNVGKVIGNAAANAQAESKKKKKKGQSVSERLEKMSKDLENF